MTFVVDVKIRLNEKKLQHLYQHFYSELVKRMLYGHRKFEGDIVRLSNIVQPQRILVKTQPVANSRCFVLESHPGEGENEIRH